LDKGIQDAKTDHLMGRGRGEAASKSKGIRIAAANQGRGQ